MSLRVNRKRWVDGGSWRLIHGTIPQELLESLVWGEFWIVIDVFGGHEPFDNVIWDVSEHVVHQVMTGRRVGRYWWNVM